MNLVNMITTGIIGSGSLRSWTQMIEQNFDLAIWPMTEASGNFLDISGNGLDGVPSAGGITRQDVELSNGDKIPSFDGSGRTNDYAFAVFVWDKMDMHYREDTRLYWFDWS